MAEYYLISQLPSLDGISENAPIPITEEQFLELCSRFLKKSVYGEVEKLTLLPPIDFKETSSVLVDRWNRGEQDLRLALGKARAEKMNKPFDLKNKNLPPQLLKVADRAVEIKNPLEAEDFLLEYRLGFLETLRPMDNFSEDFVLYYGLKLKLLLRIREFDKTIGESTYKNIYNSILGGDRLEA